jgi:hypothetical protein
VGAVATAGDNGKAADHSDESHEPRECMPCRGSGRVVSNLGGEPKDVPCPWCEGSGVRVSGIDAQASWPPNEEQPAAEQPPVAVGEQPEGD